MFERELHSLCISLPSFRLPILIMKPMLGKHGVVCLSSSDMLLVTIIFTHPSLSIIENKIVLLARTAELHDRNRQTGHQELKFLQQLQTVYRLRSMNGAVTYQVQDHRGQGVYFHIFTAVSVSTQVNMELYTIT